MKVVLFVRKTKKKKNLIAFNVTDDEGKHLERYINSAPVIPGVSEAESVLKFIKKVLVPSGINIHIEERELIADAP